MKKDKRSIPTVDFILARHGESEGNLTGITCGGEIDSPLTEKGLRQALELAEIVSALPEKLLFIYHSPMIRAKHTAEEIAKRIPLHLIEIENLREHLMGDWSTLKWIDILPFVIRKDPIPNGESYIDYHARVKKTLIDILSLKDKAFIIAHGGTFYGLASSYGYTIEGKIQNACPYYFKVKSLYADEDFPWDIYKYNISSRQYEAQEDFRLKKLD